MNWQLAFQLPHSDLLSTTWTLAIEEQFYVAWTLTLIMLLQRSWTHERHLRLALAGFATMTVRCFTLKFAGAPWVRLKGTDPGGLLLGCAVAFLFTQGVLSFDARRWRLAARIGSITLVALGVVAQPNLEVPPGFGPMVGRLIVGLLADLAAAALLIGLFTTMNNSSCAVSCGWLPGSGSAVSRMASICGTCPFWRTRRTHRLECSSGLVQRLVSPHSPITRSSIPSAGSDGASEARLPRQIGR
jgi:peptidoglycan/LPS O-acetylase OafA/YrhL